MCRYRVTKFRCGHKVKTPIPPCNLSANCTRQQAALLELKTDLSDIRAAIRLHNANHNGPDYQPLMNRIQRDYASYFGHGSTNRNNVMASLRDIEGYLDEEISAIAQNVTERIHSDDLCVDNCWEGLVILGREEQERGGDWSRR